LTGAVFHFDEAEHSQGQNLGFGDGAAVLLMVTRGQATIKFDSLRYSLGSYQCGLYRITDQLEIAFERETSTKLKILTCLSSPANLAFSELIQPHQALPRSASEILVTLLRLGSELKPSASEASNRLRDAIGEAALNAYLEQGALSNLYEIPEEIWRSKHYIEQHLADECQLSELARGAGISKAHYVSAFRKHYGVTPIRFLWQMRTRKAVDFVEKTDLNLGEISNRCGYKSQYHLSREIKRLTGMSPRQMRKAAQNYRAKSCKELSSDASQRHNLESVI
jgi:AraC family L-rhamnose operon regulatory protein RhaS